MIKVINRDLKKYISRKNGIYLSLRVKIYVVNYRKVVNICTPRGCQPGRGFGMFNGKKRLLTVLGLTLKLQSFKILKLYLYSFKNMADAIGVVLWQLIAIKI